jgi:dTDP-4-amino-4,6-dideoxygalactose transaminase
LTSEGRIPLVDLRIQHEQVAEEIAAGWSRIIADNSFILGPYVEDFEQRFARSCGVRHCIGVGNGTDALELALRALDVQAGDEVILPANTFVASALAVERIGARPVLVDVDESSFLLDTGQVGGSVTGRTKAVMPVHLYGQIAPVEQLRAVMGSDEITIVEDGAQAHGARRWGRSIGCHGSIAATSFYPGKNLGAYGDAGAVLVDTDELAASMRRLRNLGAVEKYRHDEVGYNSRLDPLQAVVLTAKLGRLQEWNEDRRRAAERYHALLGDVPGIRLPSVLDGNEHVWHLYVVRVPNRDRLMAALRASRIETGIHYPIPIHLQGAFEYLGYGPGDFPIAEKLSREILSLPMFPGISESQQERVAAVVERTLRHAA